MTTAWNIIWMVFALAVAFSIASIGMAFAIGIHKIVKDGANAMRKNK